MDIRPVRSYAAPRFPTHEILREHPEILRFVPRRWQTNPILLSALAGVVMLLTDGSHAASAAKTVVAPIFEHGPGVLNRPPAPKPQVCPPPAAKPLGKDVPVPLAGVPLPPSQRVMFTEDEAARIINEEARKAGISFQAPKAEMSGVAVPVVKSSGYLLPRDKSGHVVHRSVRIQKAKVTMDGADPKRHVAYEFVSDADYARWRAKGAKSVGIEDILGAAYILRDGLKGSSAGGYAAVFYDPVVGGAESGPKWNRTATEDALRAQVKDFIKWLKAQGVI